LNAADQYNLNSNADRLGVTYLPIAGDGTAPGCFCEGWGVSASGISGSASEDGPNNGGIQNLNLVSFVSNDTGGGPGTTATSVVTVGGSPIMVTQAYAPAAAAPNALFEAKVTITNTSLTETLTDVRYVRVMDWDIPPTEFSELVTIQGTATTTFLERSHDNGFNSADPLDPDFPIIAATADVDFTDSGPADHGAYFRFNFGDLAPGESIEFSIFYGAAGDEASMLLALGAVGVELYSLGQNNSANHDNEATFAFGFKGVGGGPILPPSGAPEPGSTFGLLALAMLGLGAVHRRQKRQ
jgi:type IV pilus assembly protein PilY1